MGRTGRWRRQGGEVLGLWVDWHVNTLRQNRYRAQCGWMEHGGTRKAVLGADSRCLAEQLMAF